MTTIETIKQECRAIIAQDATTEPGCLRGSFTPKAAKALLDLIAILERIAKPALGGKQQQASAQNQLAQLCATWEESK